MTPQPMSAAASRGRSSRTVTSASDVCAYTTEEIERIARTAFAAGERRAGGGSAGAKVSSVDKANVLETSRLWRQVVSELHAKEFPHIELEHVLAEEEACLFVDSVIAASKAQQTPA